MWRAVLLVGFVACASPRAPYRDQVDVFFAAHPTSTKHPPNVLGTGPWQLGRWATYRRVGPLRGYDRITVAALDACGTWIESVSVDVDRQHRLLVCVAPTTSADPLSIVREVRYQGGAGLPSIRIETEGDRAALREIAGPLVAKLVEPERAVGLGGEDDELVAWADDGARTSVISSLADRGTSAYFARERTSSFLSVGAGFGYFSGSSRFDGDSLGMYAVGGGVQMSPRVDLITNIALGGSDSMEPMTFVAAIGARFRPWDRIYLEGDLGYAELLLDTSTVARGAAMSLAIGVDIAERRGWRWALELRERTFLLTNEEGLRHAVAVAGVLQLDFR